MPSPPQKMLRPGKKHHDMACVCVCGLDCNDFIFLLAPNKKRVPPREIQVAQGFRIFVIGFEYIQYLQYLTCLLLIDAIRLKYRF